MHRHITNAPIKLSETNADQQNKRALPFDWECPCETILNYDFSELVLYNRNWKCIIIQAYLLGTEM